MQWVAAQQPRDGAEGAADYAKMFNGFCCVFRTCGRESTGGRQPRRNYQFVHPYGLNCQSSPCRHLHIFAPSSACSSRRSSPKSRSIADLRGFTTKSNPAGTPARDVRRISRTLRLIRLRSWAFPSLRGVVIPKRLCSRPLGSANSTKEREAFLAPLSYTALNSAAVRSRNSFGNVCALSPMGASKHLIVLHGNSLATLTAPGLQDQSASPRFHSRAKSMCLGAAAIVWLERSLWHPRAPSKT
jgi:hypothetical protein